MTPRIGSLFSGYGGLDMAVEAVTGGRTVWVSDIDKGACKILAHRFPHIPNLGDISQIDWATVEPVDVVTGGFPCQDVSHAGKRAGLHDGTRTGLWSYMRDAIDQLRPGLVVAENVRGLLSAEAASDVEPCPWCLGDTDDEPSLRALGAVLADLADIGYDAQWCGLRAADVGAPHGRFRVFVVAYPQGQPGSLGDRDTPASGDTDGAGGRVRFGPGEAGSEGRGREAEAWASVWGVPGGPSGAVAADADGLGRERARRARGRRAGSADSGLTVADSSGDGWDEGRPEPARLVGGSDAPLSGDAPAPDASRQRHGRGEDSRSLGRVDSEDEDSPCERERARPVAGDRSGPTAPDTEGHEQPEPADRGPLRTEPRHGAAGAWGIYAPAIARWEQVLGRPAPAPLRPDGRDGAHRLNPAAVEFLMGLPAGWVMDVPNLTRSEQLKAFGNGVVPQQAAAALQHLLHAIQAAA